MVSGQLARIAATAMGSETVRLYSDQIFVKVAGHSEATKWHQDLSHWPLEGSQICSLWLAVDEVTPAGGALRYLAGSHRWGKLFRPREDAPGEWPPDFDRDEYRSLERSFPLAPGDCVVHHGLTVHSSHPNSVPGTRRLAYVTRWLGEDVRFRNKGFAPAYPISVSIKDGEEPIHPLFLEFTHQ